MIASFRIEEVKAMLEIEMERRLTETEQRSKSNSHRIDTLEQKGGDE